MGTSDQFADELEGAINEKTRGEDAEPTDPFDAKNEWTSHLPN
ncbi:hypothetical protein [Halomicrobium urmianum]|nr:hypothetical protein [Halomicrobium urmianum]